MRIQSLFSLAGLAAVAALLAGCGATPFVPTSSSRPAAISGKVHGGQQPVAYSTIQLYTVGTSQDGSPSSPLLNTSVQTDADGNFNITHDYSCSSATQVYITSTGGYVTATQQNPNLVLMAALGPCSSLGPNTSITINELTTVAAVNALYPFMTSATAIGSGSSDVAALNAGFTLAGEFVNTATGLAPGAVPAGFTAPTDTLNTLADAMANCINSPGGTANDNTACGNFFGWTTPPGETPPTDTVTALLYLAQNPTLSTNSLWGSATPSAPFQPTLPAQPSNFTVALSLAPTASLTLSPSSLTFGTVPVSGTTPLQVAALTNTGTTPVAINSLVIAGTNTADFAQSTICPSILQPGSYCTIQTTFTPTATGSRSASLQINGGALSTSLSGSGQTSSTSAPTLSPSVTYFGTTLFFGATGQQQLVTLTNYDTVPLGITGIKTNNTSFFTETDNCGDSLSGQSVCNIYVTAIASGSFSGQLLINTSGGNRTVSLSAYTSSSFLRNLGTAALNTYTPYTQYLLSNRIGGGEPPIYGGIVTFQNANATLQASGFSGPPDSTPNSYNCQAYFNSCTFDISLEASVLGWQYDYGTDNNNGLYFISTFGINGSSPAITTTPLALNFGNAVVGQSSQLTLTVVDAGTGTFSYSGVNFTGPAAADYSLASATCSSLFSAENTCNVVIQFTPQATGVRNATVTVSGSGTTASAFLTGDAFTVVPVTTYPSPTASPTSLTFPSTQTGNSATPLSTTITMPNLDPASATISGTGFAISGGTTCAQGASTCQFTVTFTPAAATSYTGTLTVTDTTTNTTATVSLSGTGTTPPPPPPAVSLNPTSLTFSPRSVGQQSIAQTITLTNTGGSSLTISSVTLGGTNPGDYAMTNGCSGAIAVNGTCQISVTNTPTFTGPSSATITIVTNAASSPNVVNLSGTGQ